MTRYPFTAWYQDPLAKADSRLEDADLFYIECLIALADARASDLPVTFKVPAHPLVTAA